MSNETTDQKLDRLINAVTNLANEFVQFRQHVTEAINKLGTRTYHLERRTSSSQSMQAVRPTEDNGGATQ